MIRVRPRVEAGVSLTAETLTPSHPAPVLSALRASDSRVERTAAGYAERTAAGSVEGAAAGGVVRVAAVVAAAHRQVGKQADRSLPGRDEGAGNGLKTDILSGLSGLVTRTGVHSAGPNGLARQLGHQPRHQAGRDLARQLRRDLARQLALHVREYGSTGARGEPGESAVVALAALLSYMVVVTEAEPERFAGTAKGQARAVTHHVVSLPHVLGVAALLLLGLVLSFSSYHTTRRMEGDRA